MHRRAWAESLAAMGYFVTGIVARPEALGLFAQRHSLHQPMPLSEGLGLAILPLRDDDFDSFLRPPMTGHAEGFTYFCAQLVQELEVTSVGETIMYFETEYFGGSGSQGAVVFENGTVVFGPKSAEHGPINEALSRLGVRVVPPALDEFETVGLHRHRHTEDWLEPKA